MAGVSNAAPCTTNAILSCRQAQCKEEAFFRVFESKAIFFIEFFCGAPSAAAAAPCELERVWQ